MHSHDQIAKLEAEQYGLITYEQLRELGLSVSAIKHTLRRRRLRRVRPSVWCNPSVAASYEQDVLAAVLSAGVTAFASHTTAARLWGLPVPAMSPDLEVATALERQPRLRGVRMHRSGLLTDRDVAELRGIPVARPERAIVDMSGVASAVELGRMLDEALRRRLTTPGRVTGAMTRLKRAPGRSPKRLAAVLAARVPGSESLLEDFVLAALVRYGLPSPVRQHVIEIEGRERRIDLCYPERRLAVEAQGFEYHGLRSRFDEDALRGNELLLAGFRVLEFTSAFDDSTIAAQVAAALGVPVSAPRQPRTTFAQFVR